MPFQTVVKIYKELKLWTPRAGVVFSGHPSTWPVTAGSWSSCPPVPSGDAGVLNPGPLPVLVRSHAPYPFFEVSFSSCGNSETNLPWAPKTMKNKGFGHLKTWLFTIKTSKNAGLGGPWYIYLEPKWLKWPFFWFEKALFWLVDLYKNRGHPGSRYVYIYIYSLISIYIYTIYNIHNIYILYIYIKIKTCISTEKIQSQHIPTPRINHHHISSRSFAFEPCHILCCFASPWRSSIKLWQVILGIWFFSGVIKWDPFWGGSNNTNIW